MFRQKETLFAVTSVLISVLGVLLLAEILLRCLPVARTPFVVPVTPDNPIYRYVPNQSFVFSRDWNLALVNYGRVNNDGWVNDQDYQRGGSDPVLGIIGDSFIEAPMVPYRKTVHGRLAEMLDGKLRVYSFAASGAPLSQYLVWAQYAVNEFKASALIINVVGNDFDESSIAYDPRPGFWVYAPDEGGNLRLQLLEFHSGFIRTLLKHVALARYLFLNLHLKETLSEWAFLRASVLGLEPRNKPKYAGNTDTRTDPRRIAKSLAVLDAFFRDLPAATRLPVDRITFTMDGFRYPDAAAKGAASYFDIMRRTFRERAESSGYEVIDLDRSFFADHRSHHQRFEYPIDNHWNPRGHAVVAREFMRSRLLASIVGDSS